MNRRGPLSFLLSFCILFYLQGQEVSTNKFSSLLEVGALGGTEISRSPGDFKLGYKAQFSGLYSLKSNLSLGAGIAVEKYERETLVPLYFDLHSFLKNQINSPFLNLQVGYALAWHEDYAKLSNYNYKGGAFLGFYYGRRVPMSTKLSFNMAVGLRFQNLGVEIENTFVDKYEESINFVLLELKAGMQF